MDDEDAVIIALAADKGGVGKSALAYEVAYSLGAVLIDLDWSGGGVTTAWGCAPRARRRAPLLDALERPDTVPTPYRSAGRPDLVPSHPDWGASVIEPAALAARLSQWASAWGRPVVLDTHPGFGDKTEAALMAADLVAVPVLLRTRELDALDAMLTELGAFHVVICPNCVPAMPSLPLLKRLQTIVGRNGTAVAPPISEHRWWARRQLRAALTARPKPGRRTAHAVDELRTLAAFLQEQSHD